MKIEESSQPSPIALPNGHAAATLSPARRFFGNPWVQIVVSAILVTVAELFLKVGARNTAHLSERLSWSGVTGLASIWTWFGIIFIVLSLLSWLSVLRQMPLSIAFPLSNVVHVMIPLSCWIFLGEVISGRRWLGIALLLIGLVIVAKPFARMEEHLEEKL